MCDNENQWKKSVHSSFVFAFLGFILTWYCVKFNVILQEEDFSSPSMETSKLLKLAVQKSGMTEASLKTKAATILSASSKEKDQQAN